MSSRSFAAPVVAVLLLSAVARMPSSARTAPAKPATPPFAPGYLINRGRQDVPTPGSASCVI
jgi:hypothetical protein